ncbi:hypothetical protein L2735_11410 [Shewanella olleyana]|uniref:hypothetical protein n=1 Tax=Shewanella olleyana TaxID=135626 RepID=UPI00200C3A48|nr:hypothetical protein [Shewanella olleyana]MCL1067411.1 hypothetical protein [Shewanella olleyana]
MALLNINCETFTRYKFLANTLCLLILTMGVVDFSYADSESQQGIEDEDIFEKYGIPKELPKFGLSSLTQGDHIVEHVKKTNTIAGEETTSSFYLVQTTDTKGNVDIRIKYFPSDIKAVDGQPSLAEDGGTVDSIEYLTKTEYKLRQYAESYDKSSVTAEELGGGKVIVRFNYSKYALPQDIAYFRFMQVEIVVIDRNPISMKITNSAPFDYGEHKIERYTQKMKFERLDNGQLVIKKKTILGEGTAKGEPSSLLVEIEPVAFYDNELGTIVRNPDLLAKVSDPRIREERVEVDSVFPLMGDLVRRQGIDIPMPYGISVAYRNQNMDVDFTDFNLGLGALGFVNLDKDFDPSQSVASVQAESFSLRGDVFILPFWNVYGLLGKIKVRADVDAQYTAETMNEIKNSLNNRVPGLGNSLCKTLSDNNLPFCSSGKLRVPLSLNYDMVGVGTTLAVGYKEFFATINATFTQTKLEGNDSWSDGLVVVQPMLGYQLVDYRAQLLFGAEYQGLDATMSGSLGYVDSLQGDFDYDVGIDINQWAYLVGFNKQIGRHYTISALYNFGETRDAFTVSFGYRF